MKAIILAAGRGSRMKSLTKKKPKGLVKFREKPLIQWQLESLIAAGVTQIGVVTGYKSELLDPYNLTQFYNPRWHETNMVSSLEWAKDWLNSESCIVSYSDIFYEASAINSLINCVADLAITYDTNWLAMWEKRFEDPLSDAETFVLNANSELIEIGKKPNTVDEIQGQYMGLIKFTPKSWKKIVNLRSTLSDGLRDKMYMTEALQLVIDQTKIPIIAIPYEDLWGEVDSETDLMYYSKDYPL